MDAPAPAEAETRLTPALVEADSTPTTVIDRPELEKKRANRRGAEQAEVTAVLVSKKAGRRRRWPWVVLLVVALLGAGGAGAYLLVGEQVPSHPLPDVTQRDRATAEGALRAARFVVVVEERYIDATVPGIVTEQSPKAGTTADGKPITLKEGKTVTLVVSKGPPPTPIPDLTDLTEAKAKAEIEKVGHVPGEVARPYDETVEAGIVMSWTGKGESPPKGARVDLTVSAGPAPRTVPTLSGRTYEQAVAALEAVRLRAARNPDQYSDDDSTKGKVILASPTQGSTAKRGDVVTVTVSAGRPEVPSLNGLTVAEAEAKLADRRPEARQQVRPRRRQGLPQHPRRRLQGLARQLGRRLYPLTRSARRGSARVAGEPALALGFWPPATRRRCGRRQSTALARLCGAGACVCCLPRGRVVVNDLDAEPAQVVVDEIVAAGGDAVAAPGDVARWETGEALIGFAIETYGDLHVLVNNAGNVADRFLANMSEEEWDEVVRVHLKGHFVPTRFAAAWWRERTGRGDRSTRRWSARRRPPASPATPASPTTGRPRPAWPPSPSSPPPSWPSTACGSTPSPRWPAPA